MAYASPPLPQDQFLCSICLDVFTDPVSTPCGHNYCRACITAYWASSELRKCPMCNQTFYRIPELRVNSGFRDMVEYFKKMTVEDGGAFYLGDIYDIYTDDSTAKPGEVPCDVCCGTKLKAMKSCLVCLVSYCQTHLDPHQRVAALQRHKLIDPVENLQDRVCKKHDKMMELFCRREQVCVCVVCLRNDHMTHETVSLGEEFGARKAQLRQMKRQIKRDVKAKCLKVQENKLLVTQSRKEANQLIADSGEVLCGLAASVHIHMMQLVGLIEEQQRAAEQKAEGFIYQQQQEVAELQRRSAELEQLSKTEDHFPLLLHSLSPISSPSHVKDCSGISADSFLCVEAIRRDVAQLKETFIKEMKKLIREVRLSCGEANEGKQTFEKVKPFEDELGKIQQQYTVDVTLDPDTAHSCLVLSEDGKQVRDGGAKRNLPDNPKRFDFCHFVLGKEAFSSGRFYYEVTVKGQTGWEVGVVRESIKRKGFNISLSPGNGCWSVGLYWGNYQANANPPVALSPSQKPQKVGVFVDYEEGEVSFYDVNSRALIYSFTGCTFTESARTLRNILQYYTAGPAKTTGRLHPLLRPSADSVPLKITPVCCT
ncbi:zinc finger protein RFP-like [Diretmus argenteus]